MAQHDDALPMSELLATGGGEGIKDLLREVVRDALQGLIEEELTAAIGAAKHERTEARTGQRNGGRDRLVSTPAGDIEVKIPKLRQGSFFPSLLEPRRRVDRALWAVIMTAHVTGTSTRKVDDLVKALGCESGVSKFRPLLRSDGPGSREGSQNARAAREHRLVRVRLVARASGGRGGSRSNPSSRSSSHTPVRLSGVADVASSSAMSVTDRPRDRSRTTSDRAACLAGATRGPGRRSTNSSVSPARKSRTIACTVVVVYPNRVATVAAVWPSRK
jgi:hypothetical protein